MTFVEPYVLFRLAAALASLLLMLHAARVGQRVVRYFHLSETSEGQLSLERQVELGAASARVGAALSVLGLVLTVLMADKLSVQVRGAMCGYGVVHAVAHGPWSVVASLCSSIWGLVLLDLSRLDASTRDLSLVRPVAWGWLAGALLSLADASLLVSFLSQLDLSVVASCCSSSLDAGTAASTRGAGASLRTLVTALAALSLPLSMVASFALSRRPSRLFALTAGALATFAAPLAMGAAVLYVAPHVFEVPHHLCPYCLFHREAYFIGYPLFGAIMVGAASGLSAAIGALVTEASRPEARGFLSGLGRRELSAFAVVLVLSAAPVLRYAAVSGGGALF